VKQIFLKAKCQGIWYVVIICKSSVWVLPIQEGEFRIALVYSEYFILKYPTLWKYCHGGNSSDVASYYSVGSHFCAG
jgi:hypothetical protein